LGLRGKRGQGGGEREKGRTRRAEGGPGRGDVGQRGMGGEGEKEGQTLLTSFRGAKAEGMCDRGEGEGRGKGRANFVDLHKIPLMAACHGTSWNTASKILVNGFATLSLVDDGFYGSGVYVFFFEFQPPRNFLTLHRYFTTFARYTIPYLGLYLDPCIIISYVIIGIIFLKNLKFFKNNFLILK
jgi:hypothetical protein